MGRELDDEIRRAIEELNSLLDGERAVSKLIALGEAAKPALREFLLKGKPRGIYQPRRWAVEALAGLGAKDALLEYLRMSKRIADPVVRMGEEAVENEAARQLGAWRTGEVFEALLDVARERRRAGVLEALG
jgi:HEAT repeat protein